jgi:phytoene desaturase
MMYLGIEGKYDLPHHTIHISEDYSTNLREIEDDHVLSPTPSFYVQNASVTDPTLAPPGHSTLYVLAPVTHQHPNVDWTRDGQSFRQLLLNRLELAGFKDVAPRIRYKRVITPADWDERYEIYRGATFNLAHSLGQMLHLRPHNRFEDLDGVYLVGGGTHPGSGLPVIFESARISARLLSDDLGLRPSINGTPLDESAPVGGGSKRWLREPLEMLSRLLDRAPTGAGRRQLTPQPPLS